MILVTFITHAATGLIAGKTVSVDRARHRWFWIFCLLLPVIPDLDTAFMRWVPYESPLGHRGFSHSLPFAALIAIPPAWLCVRRGMKFPGRMAGLWAFFFLLTASHGLLDAMTHWPGGHGGHGVGFFVPLVNERFFLPWTPIPVSPIGIHFFKHGGWKVLLFELVFIVLPLSAVYLITAMLVRIRRRKNAR